MRLSTRDLVATALVGAALVLYAAWFMGPDVPWFADPSAVAVVVLVLGALASMSAVVPGFAELLRVLQVLPGGGLRTRTCGVRGRLVGCLGKGADRASRARGSDIAALGDEHLATR